uniref:Uncharacterized protein n=1 Tax=Helianthus annuus TaxID=4232 RepID=A0A251TFL3_HELAN
MSFGTNPISISLIKQTIGGHMSPNGASQLSRHIGNEVAISNERTCGIALL